MSCRTGLLACLLAVSVTTPLLFTACGRKDKSQPALQRIAVLRCENLSPDPKLDWIGRALSEIIATQLTGVSATQVIPLAALRAADQHPPTAPGISTEREAALAAGANRILYCSYSTLGENLRASASLEDTSSERIVLRSTAEAPQSGGLFTLADTIAKQVNKGQVRAFASYNQDAVHAWADALDAPDPEVASEDLARAVAADPDFGRAYRSWLEIEIGRRNRAAAEHVLELANARGTAIPEYERARLALDAATLSQDAAARSRALSALAKLDPADSSVLRGLAEDAFQGRRYREAIVTFQKILAVTPDDVSTLNELGYAEAYLGDIDAAMDALRSYERLQPNQANPLDSQGDVNFYFGRYAEAEKLYLAAQQKDPNFLSGGELLKAAQARASTGDVQGADAIFARYIAPFEPRHDGSATFNKALWLYVTGRRKEAVGMLLPDAGKYPQYAAQLALWELALGDREVAAGHATQAAQASHGAVPVLIPLALYLTAPDASPAEWQTRAERLFAQPNQAVIRDQASAYALLFHRQFQSALPLLRQSYDRSGANTEGLPVLLAWAMMESGKWDGMTSLVGPTPLPASGGIGWLTSLYYPRIFYLRARNLDRQGKKDQARENYALYLKLAGPTPEIWGEEKQAQAALGGK